MKYIFKKGKYFKYLQILCLNKWEIIYNKILTIKHTYIAIFLKPILRKISKYD